MSDPISAPTLATTLTLALPSSHHHHPTHPGKTVYPHHAHAMFATHQPSRATNGIAYTPSQTASQSAAKRPAQLSMPDASADDADACTWLLTSDAPASNCVSSSRVGAGATCHRPSQSDAILEMTSSLPSFAASLSASVDDPTEEMTGTLDQYPDVFGHLHVHDLMDVDSISMAFNAHEHLSTPLLHLSRSRCVSDPTCAPLQPRSPASSTLPSSPPTSSVPSMLSSAAVSSPSSSAPTPADATLFSSSQSHSQPSICHRPASAPARIPDNPNNIKIEAKPTERDCPVTKDIAASLKKSSTPTTRLTIPLTLPLTPTSAMLALRKRKRCGKNADILDNVSGSNMSTRLRRRDARHALSTSVPSKPTCPAVNHANGFVAEATSNSDSVSAPVSRSSDDGDKAVAVRLKCIRCSMSAKRTPMMRKGPDGCRSLCNACGLKWSRHGVF